MKEWGFTDKNTLIAMRMKQERKKKQKLLEAEANMTAAQRY